ncbi:hypothetical protein Tcan_10243 [Toxocara canis]|uniref:Crossover junction endonuclease EME1 n=1 Tax=Toxocara canis TaxID=6265 RepID=A0A0B2UMX4_TOXCA|nr:hypothetical protein Tcan_10243 [Toxocara canis]
MKEDDPVVLSDSENTHVECMSMARNDVEAGQNALMLQTAGGKMNANPIGGSVGAVFLEVPPLSSSFSSSPGQFLFDEKYVEEEVQHGSQHSLPTEPIQCLVPSAVEHCVVSVLDANLLAAFDGLQDAMRTVFTERGIPCEVVHRDGTAMCVYWRIKRSENCEDEAQRGNTSKDYEAYWRDVMVCVDGVKFDELVDEDTLLSFIGSCTSLNAIITIVVYGRHNQINELSPLVFEAFEEKRTHVRYVSSAMEMALLILHSHRSIARWKPNCIAIFERVLGKTQGLGLATDWWMKMLTHAHRMGDEEKRALVARFPNAFDLAKTLKKLGEKEGTKLIAETRTRTDGCIGPAIGRKIFLLLTSELGVELVDR